ncbi:hypothetical protein VTK56DRAFT_6789 [Thermocarpiscus australiensis]
MDAAQHCSTQQQFWQPGSISRETGFDSNGVVPQRKPMARTSRQVPVPMDVVGATITTAKTMGSPCG